MNSIKLFVIACLVLLSGASSAQISGGVKGGAALTKLSVSKEAASYRFGPGFQFGAFLDYSTLKFGLELDALFAIQKSRVEVNGEDLSAEYRYVMLPLAAKYRISQWITLQAGPQVSFLNCYHSTYHPVAHQPFDEQDYTKAFKKTDAGVFVGVGYNSMRAGWIADLRYYHGLSDISNYEGLNPTYTRSIQLCVGYRIFQDSEN